MCITFKFLNNPVRRCIMAIPGWQNQDSSSSNCERVVHGEWRNWLVTGLHDSAFLSPADYIALIMIVYVDTIYAWKPGAKLGLGT